MERYSSCRYEPIVEVKPPPKAVCWSAQQYYDGNGWIALPDKSLALKPTKFTDNRLLFLEAIEGVAPEFASVQTGKYDVKCWSKFGTSVGVEGDTRVFIKTVHLGEVAVYAHHERLPTFPKTWKPLVFLVNASVSWVRLTENLCLLTTVDGQHKLQVSCVDYNGGFLCSHPCTDLGLAYGSYVNKTIESLTGTCQVIPHIACAKGEWGFFVFFYTWGAMFVPKAVDIARPGFMGNVGLAKKVDCVALVFHPPNIFLRIHLDAPKGHRQVEYCKDYLVTASKSSETDIDIYLIMDGQLVKYNYSFDIRINKHDKPKKIENVGFKCTVDLEDKKKINPKYHFHTQKNETVLVAEGCAAGGNDADHLVNRELVGIFDAEICLHLTHPPVLELCKAFDTVAIPADDPTP